MQPRKSVNLHDQKITRNSLIPIISSIGDGDGEVDASSLMRFIGTHRDLQKQHSQVKMGLAAIAAILLMSILANFFTTQAVIELSKDFKPNSVGGTCYCLLWLFSPALCVGRMALLVEKEPRFTTCVLLCLWQT